MNARHVFLTLAVLLCCGFANPAWAYVATFDDAGIDGVYLDVGGSGVDVTCVSINDGFTYLSSVDLLSDTYDYAYAGNYDYDHDDGIIGSGVWMMDDNVSAGDKGGIIEFGEDVYFEQIWFAQAGDDYPVQGDSAFVSAYTADDVLCYKTSVNFDSPEQFNQWFCISPPSGFEDVLVRKLVLTFANINYGVWDHLVFDADNNDPDPEDPDVISATIDIHPGTLSLNSKARWTTCYITLPKEYNVADIDFGTVLLEDGIAADPDQSWADETEQVAICKFSRSEVQAIVQPGSVELTVSGEFIDGTVLFEGSDTIKVVPDVSDRLTSQQQQL